MGEIKKAKIKKNFTEEKQEAEILTYGNEPYNLKWALNFKYLGFFYLIILKFSFGYSNILIVLGFFVRVEPFTSLFIESNGKFDGPKRMLSDVQKAWETIWESTQWNNELTPEWFYLPRIFINKSWIDFGTNDNNENVSDVAIPSKFDSQHFLYWMHLRKALRNYHYSKHLNFWIDLIFGSKQQKKNYMNVFFEFATQKYYEGEQGDIDREILKSAANFYQLPSKLFSKDHKPKDPEYCHNYTDKQAPSSPEESKTSDKERNKELNSYTYFSKTMSMLFEIKLHVVHSDQCLSRCSIKMNKLRKLYEVVSKEDFPLDFDYKVRDKHYLSNFIRVYTYKYVRV